MPISVDPDITTLRAASDRLDSFVNLLTGQGDPMSDKGSSWDVQAVMPLSMEQLKRAYRGSYYARRVVDLVAEDAVVRGWTVIDPTDPRAAQDARWKQQDNKHNLLGILSKSLKWARAYGTGYIVPITYDLQPLDQPLILDMLYDVQDVVVLDPFECRPQTFYSEDTPITRLTEPAAFRITAGAMSTSFKGRWGHAFSGMVDIHPSRIIPIIGAPLSVFDRVNHPYGLGDSVLQAMWLALARADGIDGAGALLAQEIKQDVVTVPDLKAIGTSDAREAFQLRMKLFKLSKSLLNMIVLGAGELYESRASNVTGFRDLSENARNALVAATGIPEPILFGKATSGLATAPGTEQEAYIRKIETIQVQDVLPAITQLYKLIASAKLGAFGGVRRYRDFQIEFNPLIRESVKERDARSLIHAQRDSIHAGMISSADPEVGAGFARFLISNRYGPHGWQDQLPEFRPADWAEPEVPESPKQPVPPGLGGPPPGNTPDNAPQGPDGQTPSQALPQEGGQDIGAQGVDLQANNTGKGRFDSHRLDSQSALTEWVLIDADAYEGTQHTLLAAAKAQAQKVLYWKQKYPEISKLLEDTEWRAIQQFSIRLKVGDETLRQMAEMDGNRGAYDAGQAHARLTGEPWKEAAILRWMAWGGTPGINWAKNKRLGIEEVE